MKPRSWHIAQPLYNYTSTECRVAIFGGNVHVEGMWGDRKNAADLTILSFGQLLSCYCSTFLEIFLVEKLSRNVAMHLAIEGLLLGRGSNLHIACCMGSIVVLLFSSRHCKIFSD